MKRLWWLILPLLAVLVCSQVPQAVCADEGKGTVVELDALKATTPADWKNEPLDEKARQFGRYLQFKLPRVEGDKEDAELIIYKGFGGSARDNVARWKGQFEPPEGKKLDDVAKTTEFKVGEVPVTLLDIQGTFLAKNPPFAPNAKIERHPDYRMFAAQFDGKDTYHIKLVGPAKTVEHHQKGFEEWLKNFK